MVCVSKQLVPGLGQRVWEGVCGVIAGASERQQELRPLPSVAPWAELERLPEPLPRRHERLHRHRLLAGSARGLTSQVDQRLHR